MAKSFDQLAKKTMSADARRKADARSQQLIADMLLGELRKHAGLTQKDLAEALGVKQPNVAKMEGQDDMQVTTLRRVVEALGGKLEIIAHMPKGDFRVTQFNEVEATAANKANKRRRSPAATRTRRAITGTVA